jgi:hypothetical protein
LAFSAQPFVLTNPHHFPDSFSALAEQEFDAAEFPFAFLQAFGNKETTIKRLRGRF